MYNRLVYRISSFIGQTIARLLYGWRVEGRVGEIPPGPFILAANHSGIIDPWLVGCVTDRPVFFMAKEELFRIPVLKQWLRLVGSFPVRRGEPDRESIRTALRILGEGGIVGIFVEGTRNPEGRPLPVQHGAAMLAVRAGVPILPVAMAVEGRRRVTRVGSPILAPEASGASRRALYEQLSHRIGEAISQLKENAPAVVGPSLPQRSLPE